MIKWQVQILYKIINWDIPQSITKLMLETEIPTQLITQVNSVDQWDKLVQLISLPSNTIPKGLLENANLKL